MSNPLIDSKTDIGNAYGDGVFAEGDGWEKGITAIEAGEEIATGIMSGDWVEAGLGFAAAGLDVYGAATDPIGYFSGQLVSWMLEHLEPLRRAMHALTGEPGMVKAYGASWGNISTEMAKIGQDYVTEAEQGTSQWTGGGAAKYRSKAHQMSNYAQAAAVAANTLKTTAEMASELVAGVRTMVRDVISTVVGTLISLLIEEACTVGLATPVVVAQGTSAIARAAAKIGTFLAKLAKSVGSLSTFLVALRDLIDGVYKEIRTLAQS